MDFTKEHVPEEPAVPAAPQHSWSELHSAFGLHGSFRANMQAYGKRPWLGRDAQWPLWERCLENRAHMCGWSQGTWWCHQWGISRHQPPEMHHPLEAQHTERCPQRWQGGCCWRPETGLPHRDRNYTVEQAWDEWQQFCAKWGRYYRSIRRRGEDASYKAYFTYLNYDHRIQSMIYTTNWIGRLQKDFRRGTRMRGAMPNEESVILLMGKTAMDKKSYLRQVPRIDLDRTLFPDE